MAATGSAVGPEDVQEWGPQLDEVTRRIGARFPRSETRDRVRADLAGRLGPVQRQKAWQVAEPSGDADADPDGVQDLMGRADWDPDAVRDDRRGDVREARGDPEAVLVRDETGVLKKRRAPSRPAWRGSTPAPPAGLRTPRSASCWPPPAGTARHGGHRPRLAWYLPEQSTGDPRRCQAAGVPEDAGGATKPGLAQIMRARAFDAAVPAARVTGDEV